MPPERKNTHRLSLDTIAGMNSLFGSVTHAYDVLRLGHSAIDMRRFRAACAHLPVTFDEMTAIESAWERWQEHFLGEAGKRSDFYLPENLIARRRGRPVIHDEF